MLDEEQQLIEAANHYLQLLDQDQVISIHDFAATVDPALRMQLIPYLQDVLDVGQPQEAVLLTAEEQAMADRVAARMRDRVRQQLGRDHPRSLTELREGMELSIGALARQINLPVDLLARIERRAVLVSSIPTKLITRLATALHEADATVRTALQAPQAGSTGEHIGVREEATVRYDVAVSFAEALAYSTATAAEREEWAEEQTQ